MAAENEAATFAINLEGDVATKSAQIADSIEGLRQKISGGVNAIKEMNTNLRALKGNSDEVKAAKEKLKDSIAAEKDALSSAKSAMADQGKEMKNLVKGSKALADEKKKLAEKNKKLREELKDDAEKKAADRTKALGAAISTAGGPVAALRDKLAGLKDIMGEGGAGGASSLLTLGIAGLAAAAAALVVGVIAAGYALSKFILRGADAARSLGLMREAAMNGNAQWGKNFGEQVDALALKVPTSKDKIDELGKSLAKSRIGGQIWVDTLNAVTQASAALGEDSGNALKGFIERGKQFNRFQLNPLEMVGTGIDFKDVAEALSKNMKIGVKDATAALFEGRVKLGDGAKALRDAVEKKVGGINLRQMLSLDNIVKKLGETFDSLTKGVDIEPILKGFKELADLFSLNNVTGQALKTIVETFGKEMGVSITSTTPIAKRFIQGLVIGALQITIAYLQVRNSLRDTFADSKILKGVDGLGIALTVGKYAAIGLAVAVVSIAAVMAVGLVPILAFGAAMVWISKKSSELGKSIRETFIDIDWKATGAAILDGLLLGITSGSSALLKGIKGLAKSIKGAFTGELEIHSPSKVFERYGENIDAGLEKGVENGAPGAQSAVSSMVSVPSGGGGGGGRAAPIINITINASGGNAKEIAEAVSSSSVIEQIVKAIIDASQGGGVGVPA